MFAFKVISSIIIENCTYIFVIFTLHSCILVQKVKIVLLALFKYGTISIAGVSSMALCLMCDGKGRKGFNYREKAVEERDLIKSPIAVTSNYLKTIEYEQDELSPLLVTELQFLLGNIEALYVHYDEVQQLGMSGQRYGAADHRT